MIVTADPTGVGLPPGTIVQRINGAGPAAMLAALMPFARADGHNDAKRVALLGVEATDRIEYFDVFHGLVYGVPPGGVHRLVARLPDDRAVTREAAALTLAERRAQMAPAPAGDGPVWTWTVRPDGIARG